MRELLYVAWRYLAYHRIKTAILVASIALILFLPAGLNVLVGESADELRERARATPLLVGGKGSPLELVLNSLYFESAPPATTSYGEVRRVAESGFADAIPLYVRFRARQHPIVGTSLEYFDFRNLHFAEGRPMAVLGECVLGFEVARSLGIGLGASVVSSSESVFDLAGVYPLRMKVVGVLGPSHTPDDRAIFVDVKTAWIIEGLGHGHRDLSAPGAASQVLSRSEERIIANASVVQYNEITAENIESFHFHGDLDANPLTAVVALPDGAKSRALLLGRYQSDEVSQIVAPDAVMDELLETILTVREYVIAAVVIAGVATLATAALVFLLSLRLRRREIETMLRIGASRATVATLVASELAFVLASGALVAGALTLLTSRFGSAAIRALLLS